MNRTITAFPVLALLLVSACGNENATAPEPTPGAETRAPANEGATLFSNAEMQMNEGMMAVRGANAADAWVRKMIEHHRGAIRLSEILLAQPNVSAQVAEHARTMMADQQRDVQHLERMLQGGVEGSGEASAYAANEQQMHQQMMAVSGADPAQTWLRKMIEHHRGGVTMSNTAISQAGNQQVVAMARETIEKQNREIAELQRMLQG